ncbi:MAG: ATP-grasp domain-containing protein, partial [Phycisphaerales bacterium]|nr:ATP-grasp domain-containing protein [Phycisphaerales bacterium]
VGSGPTAARHAMDKMASKLHASGLGIRTPEAVVVNPNDETPPFAVPFVVKPVHEGSSVGLHLCGPDATWTRALEAMRADLRHCPERVYMAERMIRGREITVGILGHEALPLLEIRPASGPYDYEAKYVRDDTIYVVDPDVPNPHGIAEDAVRLATSMGVRHLARVDFFVDETGLAWFLEINTMPGFTSHSLVPKAAAARGLSFDALCEHLVRLAVGTPTCR